MRVKYIFVHTAAWHTSRRLRAVPDVIDSWHRKRGWSGFGYHWWVPARRPSRMEELQLMTDVAYWAGWVDAFGCTRRAGRVGAGVRGWNAGRDEKGRWRSEHICMEGHGDHEPLTEYQELALVDLLAMLCRDKYGLDSWAADYTAEVPILGHRDRGAKSCPGKLVNLDPIITEVRHRLTPQHNGPGALPHTVDPGP